MKSRRNPAGRPGAGGGDQGLAPLLARPPGHDQAGPDAAERAVQPAAAPQDHQDGVAGRDAVRRGLPVHPGISGRPGNRPAAREVRTGRHRIPVGTLGRGDFRPCSNCCMPARRRGRLSTRRCGGEKVERIRAVAGDEDEDAGQPHKVYRKALKVVDQIFTDVRMGEIPSSGRRHEGGEEHGAAHHHRAPCALRPVDAQGLRQLHLHPLGQRVGHLAGRRPRLRGSTRSSCEPSAWAACSMTSASCRIDVNIITKPGRLTDAEFESIKQHPRFGADIIAQMEGVTEEVMDIVLGHHLRYDRTGYPADAAGRPVSRLVDMAAIADSLRRHDHPALLPAPVHPPQSHRPVARRRRHHLAPDLRRAVHRFARPLSGRQPGAPGQQRDRPGRQGRLRPTRTWPTSRSSSLPTGSGSPPPTRCSSIRHRRTGISLPKSTPSARGSK